MTRSSGSRKGSDRATALPLSDFPIVFMSYDEPWADDAWAKLLAVRPDAKRVHGVTGLNACHVAAAECAGTEWFLTVDADTEVSDSILSVTVPQALLKPVFRLDWQSRNAVNGIVSGNGSLKLWPRGLVRRMRSHEAAPDDTISLDADIGSIMPGRSRIVLMPGCHSTTHPARTPFHAFRAGFRETSFLSWLLRQMASLETPKLSELRQVLTVWCSLGTHERHGDWMIFGARMGLWAEQVWRDWDIRVTHDYDWFQQFWRRDIRARIGTGGARCQLSGHAWDADALRLEIAALGEAMSDMADIPMAELDPKASRTMAEAKLFPAARALESVDSLGRVFQKGHGVPVDIGLAESLFQDAALLQHPSAITNLARLHQLNLLNPSDHARAEMLFRQAMALSCAYAPYHLSRLLTDRGDKTATEDEILRLIDVSAERGFAPEEEVS